MYYGCNCSLQSAVPCIIDMDRYILINYMIVHMVLFIMLASWLVPAKTEIKGVLSSPAMMW